MDHGWVVFSGEPRRLRWQLRSPEFLKTTRNRSKYTWFASFFHVDFKYAISFQWIISENQKRSEQVFKTKNQTQDLAQIEANKQPRKQGDMKTSWMVLKITWLGLCEARFELNLLLATVAFFSSNSFTFLCEKWWILAPEYLAKVFWCLDFEFEVEFCDLEFLIMKKNGVLWEVRQLPFFGLFFLSP
jgi:hypothetical protein